MSKSKYERLVVVDEYNNNYNIIYGRVYKVNFCDSLCKLVLIKEYKSPGSLNDNYILRIPNWDRIRNQDLDSIMGEIDQKTLDRLIDVINNPVGLSSLLAYYGIDSAWHTKNKERLIQKWLLDNDKKDKIEKEYAKHILNEFDAFKRMAYQHILQRNTSGYSNTVIAFEGDQDTIVINSSGQESFQIPWKADSNYINYNPELSALISQLLPDDLIINKRALDPTLTEFENGILKELSFKVNFFDRKKFKKYLRKHSW